MIKSDKRRYKAVTETIPTVNIRFRAEALDRLGKGTVQLVIHLQDKKLTLNSGVKVLPKDWNDAEKKVKSSDKQHSDFNLIIDKGKAKLNNIFIKYRLQDKELTFELIKDEYERPTQGFNYLQWLETEIEARRGDVTDSTIAQFHGHLEKLREFKKKVAFAELTVDLFADFNTYMKVKLHNSNNTRWNTLKTHRTFINIAKRKGIMLFNPLDRMPVKRTQSDRVYLDLKEVQLLMDLYHKHTLNDTYQSVLRHFLFSCYTGLRISDLQRIRMEDILHNILIVVPHKTMHSSGVTVRIPLVPAALELIADEAGTRDKGLVFHTFSEQRMREYIKLVVAHAKIKKQINWHSSRHTFATNFLKTTNNIAALQKLLGHQNISQTMVYAHIITDDLEHEMDVFGKS